MRIVSQLAFATVAASALSCSADGFLRESSQQREDGIYYGSLDTTHQAVVAIFIDGGLCSGTIVAVSGSSAYVLTAAHCVTGSNHAALPVNQFTVMMGNDLNNPTVTYAVTAVKFHPLYDFTSGSANDFGMLKISAASANTPFIPAMTPAQDNLAVSTQLNLVGYGRTQTSTTNTRRYHIVKPIAALYSPWIVFDQSGTSGGTCSGDSGGPALTTTGTELVAGVTSFGTGTTCTEDGYDGRVSTVYNSFIKPFIDGTTGTISCAECDNAATAGAGACVGTIETCFSNTSCNSFYDCLSQCADAACQNLCVTNNPAGADLYFAITDCICSSCSTECGSDPMCAQPTCGMSLTPTTCDTCSDSSCCSQEQACADDAVCSSCLTSSPPAACSTNAPWDSYWNCLASQCATQCGISDCGFTSSDVTCDDCLIGNCCAEGKACGDDATCTACVTQDPAPAGCAANALANGFNDCLASHCATECGAGGTGGTGGTGGAGGTGGTGGTGGAGGTGGTGGTGGAGGTGGTGGTGGAGATGGDGGVGGSAGSGGTPGTGATGGQAGTGGSTPATGGAAGTPGAPIDTSGDSGGCATSSGPRSAGGAFAVLLLGAALTLRRRR